MKVIDTAHLVQFRSEARSLFSNTSRDHRGQPEGTAETAAGDRVTLGQNDNAAVTYAAGLREGGLQSPYELLRSRLVELLQEQGVALQVATDSGGIDIASLTVEDAEALVAEDGYFGVEQTSERIFQFAIGLAGDDRSRLDEILRGIEDGFAEAEQSWGGTLPEISYRTKDAIMGKIDLWLEGGSQPVSPS